MSVERFTQRSQYTRQTKSAQRTTRGNQRKAQGGGCTVGSHTVQAGSDHDSSLFSEGASKLRNECDYFILFLKFVFCQL